MAALNSKPLNLIFYFCTLIIIFSASCSTAELLRLLQPAKPDGTVSFLVIGDWGRRGSYNQSQVALQMGEIGDELDIDFVISTGDNFYDNGLTGLHDSLFQESFTNIYTMPSLDKPWYSVLGNHDYRGDVEAQLSPTLKTMDNRWICIRSFIVNAELVDLFFIDTTPFVDKYFIQPNKHVYDWRGVLPRDTYLNNLLKANEVDLYVNGHDHCLQHISSVDSKIQFMTSGGGSKAWKGDVDYLDPQELKFYYDGQGFMSVQVSEAELRVVFYDASGHDLHRYRKTYDEGLHFAS